MAVEIRVPTLGESVVEATVGKWLKQEGDTVAAGEPLVELETDKVNVEVAAERRGVLEQIVKGEGETSASARCSAMIGAGAAAQPPAGARTAAPAASAPRRASAPPAAAPAAGAAAPIGSRARAADLAGRPARSPPSRASICAQVAGSGPGGRVTKEDVAAPGHRDRRPAPAASVRPRHRQPPSAAAPSPAARQRPRPPAADPRARSACACRAAARRSPRGWSRRSTPRRC